MLKFGHIGQQTSVQISNSSKDTLKELKELGAYTTNASMFIVLTQTQFKPGLTDTSLPYRVE
jgi:hypothetical protein